MALCSRFLPVGVWGTIGSLWEGSGVIHMQNTTLLPLWLLLWFLMGYLLEVIFGFALATLLEIVAVIDSYYF